MAKVVLGMTMSLDGYINDRSGSVGRLYRDLDELRNSELLRNSIQHTGAVIMGKNAFNMAEDTDWYAGNYEYQVPIFVLCGNKPQKNPKETEDLTFTFVTEGIEHAITLAKEAAGDKEVTVIGGASTFQQCINSALIDELHIDIMPVLLGEGLKLFEHIAEMPIELKKIRVVEVGERTCFQFRME